MLTIRLTRKGKKNQPFFRVVVIDKRRSSRGGRAVEILGYVDPLTKRKSFKKERILYWIKNGAKPSATMHNLLVREKIIEGKKIAKHKKPKKAAAPAETSASKIEAIAPTTVGVVSGVEVSSESAVLVKPVETLVLTKEQKTEASKEELKKEEK